MGQEKATSNQLDGYFLESVAEGGAMASVSLLSTL